MTRLPYWSSIRKFQLEEPIRARDLAWAAFLLSIAKGKAHDIQNWRELRTRFHVIVTGKIDVARDCLCSELEPDDPFPLDRQWICATNKLVNQVNHDLQEWRSQRAEYFGVVSAFTELIKSLCNCPGLPEAQQLEFIEMLDTSDLPRNDIHTFEGDRFILLLNTDTQPGLAKGRRCCALQMKNRTVVCQFDDDEARTLTRIRLMLVEAAHITALEFGADGA
jgi:hypothetical protein